MARWLSADDVRARHGQPGVFSHWSAYHLEAIGFLRGNWERHRSAQMPRMGFGLLAAVPRDMLCRRPDARKLPFEVATGIQP